MEGWGDLADRIAADPSSDSLQRGLENLAELLAHLVDAPEKVTLVVPIHLELALTQRDGGVPYAMGRGPSTVVGKTMRRESGIEVLIDVSLLYDVDDNGSFQRTPAGQLRLKAEGLALARGVVAHEAQHAIMMQRNADYQAYHASAHGSEWPPGVFVIAAQMCDEHRAEWNAARVLGPKPWRPADVESDLSALGSALAVAYSEFQMSSMEAVRRSELYKSVVRACSPFWRAMAYWASAYRSDDGFVQVSSATEDLDLWQRYVGVSWEPLCAALSKLPVSDLASSSDVLVDAARQVCIWILLSLKQVGFGVDRAADGSWLFDIEKSNFPS